MAIVLIVGGIAYLVVRFVQMRRPVEEVSEPAAE
jgi:hypothetical protein